MSTSQKSATNTRKIGRNIGFLSVASMFRGGTSFVINAYLARALGPALFGVFSAAFVLNTIVFRLTAGGFEILTTRDIARNHKLTNYYTSNMMTIRTIVVTVTTIVMGVYAWNAYDHQAALVCLLLALTWAFFYVANILFATLRAHELMQYEAYIYIAYSIFTLVVGIFAVRLTKSVVVAAWVFAIGNLLLLALTYAAFVMVFHYWPRFAFQWSLWAQIWREGWPLAAANLLNILYSRIDILILSFMATEEAVGWYNAAFNFVIAAGLISTVIATALLPQLSTAYERNFPRFLRLYRLGLLMLAGAGIVIGILFTLGSPKIISFAYGKGYEPSVAAFQILSWAMVLSQLDTFTVTVLTAMNQVKITLYIMFAAVIIKTIINMVLIPQWGLYAAAVANLAGELLVTTGTLIAIEYYRRTIRSPAANLVEEDAGT